MPSKLVIGLQHGDEGKGRVVDDLCQSWANVVVRFQGGGNAGHTVYDKEGNKFVTHILPVGVLSEGVTNYIAKGCVLNPVDLAKEIKEFNIKPDKLQISGLTPIIEPVHLWLDRVKYQGKIGTTAKGIGPAYSSFYARDSILFKDFVGSFYKSHSKIIDNMESFLNSNEEIKFNEEIYLELLDDYKIKSEEILDCIDIVKPFLTNNENFIQDSYASGSNILLEGAQGWGLNVMSHEYPNVTSSMPTVGGAINSTGLNHKQIDEVIGVAKIYKTKVGSGNFSSRCKPVSEAVLSHFGKEFGATTGRPRKCGWLDIDEIKQACLENGVDHIVLTKTDVFTHLNNQFIYIDGDTRSIMKIKEPSLEDPSFISLLIFIKEETNANTISFTTGPNRGEIIWGG